QKYDRTDSSRHAAFPAENAACRVIVERVVTSGRHRMLKQFYIGARVLLAVALGAAILGATPGYADTRDADLVKQGTDALRHREYDVAIARFSDAIRLAPEDAEGWSRRGEAYADKGDHIRARADCAQA